MDPIELDDYLEKIRKGDISFVEFYCEKTSNYSIKKLSPANWETFFSQSTGVSSRVEVNDKIFHSAVEAKDNKSISKAFMSASAKSGHKPSSTKPTLVSLPSLIEKDFNHQNRKFFNNSLTQLKTIESGIKSFFPNLFKCYIQYHHAEQELLISSSGGQIFTKACDHRIRWGCSVDLYFVGLYSEIIRFERNRGGGGSPKVDDLYDFLKEIKDSLVDLPDKIKQRTPPAGKFDVVFKSGTSGILFHELLGHFLEESNLDGGVDNFMIKSGDCISSKQLSVIDDANHPGGFGSRKIDDVGLNSQSILLVEKGVIRKKLIQKSNPAKNDVAEVPCARRQDYRYPPMSRMSNTIVENGSYSSSDVFSEVKTGIYVTKIIEGLIDSKISRFTLYVLESRLIEDGKLSSFLKPLAIEGNNVEFLKQLRGMANDQEDISMYCESFGVVVPVGASAPTCYFSQCSIRPLSQKEIDHLENG